MLRFVLRWVGGLFTPLIDRASDAVARLLLKAALFLLAGLAALVVVFALTLAFGLWVARDMGAIAGAGAVAGLYALIAALAAFFALRSGQTAVPTAEAAAAATDPDPERAAQIDDFASPVLDTLSRLGLHREQLAVLAGTSLAKRINPVILVALALFTGLLVGRNWRSILSVDLLTPELTGLLTRLFGDRDADEETEAPAKESKDAAPDDDDRGKAAA